MKDYKYSCNCEICGRKLKASSIRQWSGIKSEWAGNSFWVCVDASACAANVKAMRDELAELKKQKVTA